MIKKESNRLIQAQHAAKINQEQRAKEEKLRAQKEAEEKEALEKQKKEQQRLKKIQQDTQQLINLSDLLKSICGNQLLWNHNVRISREKNNFKPSGINAINQSLEKIDGQDLQSIKDLITDCRNIANSKHSKYFQWAHSLIRGRAKKTNELYNILKNISCETPESITEISSKLEAFRNGS